MIQMDVPAAYVCAQIFAYCGRDWLGYKEASVSGRYTALAVVYALGVIGPCGLYLYSGWPEWEMMYWFKDIKMATENYGNPYLALVAPAFLIALGVAAAVGFMLAHKWIIDGAPRKVLVSLWLGVAVSLGMVLVTPSAPMLIGHFSDYHAYVNEAVMADNAMDYGIINIGSWKMCLPWSARESHLADHNLITFFNPRFFVPWLIDIVMFLGTAIALARWFKRDRG